MPRASKAETIVKTVSPSGQISLGKKYAGKTVIIENPEEGTWVIKTGVIIPENEKWLHTPEMQQNLKDYFEWSANRTPQATNLDEFEAMMLEKIEERDQQGKK